MINKNPDANSILAKPNSKKLNVNKFKSSEKTPNKILKQYKTIQETSE